MGADIADTQPGGVEPNNLVIHPVDPGLPLLDQFRLETSVPVTGHRDGHLPVLTFEHLA